MNHTHMKAVDAPAPGVLLPTQHHPRSRAWKRFLLRLLAQLIFMHACGSYHPSLPEHSDGMQTFTVLSEFIVIPSKVTKF